MNRDTPVHECLAEKSGELAGTPAASQCHTTAETFHEMFGSVPAHAMSVELLMAMRDQLRALQMSDGFIAIRVSWVRRVVGEALENPSWCPNPLPPSTVSREWRTPKAWLDEPAKPIEPTPNRSKLLDPLPPPLTDVELSTPLADVIQDHFIPDRSRDPRRRGTNRYTVCVNWMRRYLGREPLVSDLVPETLNATVEMFRARGRNEETLKTYQRAILAVWRYLDDRGVPVHAPARSKGFREKQARTLMEQNKAFRGGPIFRKPLTPEQLINPLYAPEPVEEIDDPETDLDQFVTFYAWRKLRGKTTTSVARHRSAVAEFSKFLKRPAKISDLTSRKIEDFLWFLRNRPTGNAVETVNAIRAKMIALGNFAWRENLLAKGPTVEKMAGQKRVPDAWTIEEMARIFAACRQTEGTICGIPANLWMETLISLLWNSSERVTAILCARWRDYDPGTGILLIPAEQRKGRREDRKYKLHRDTMQLLEKIRFPFRDLIVPWPYSKCLIFSAYRRVLRMAGLPHGRRDLFHKIRRSVASHFKRAGGDPTALLGHSGPDVTRRYLAPEICGPDQASNLLPQPGSLSVPTERRAIFVEA